MAATLAVLSVLATGLYAGYLLAFQSGVMPALREAEDAQFTQVMRKVNEKVPGPVFLLLLLGSVGLPAASLWVPPAGATGTDRALTVAALLVFNVADAAITIGVVILLARALLVRDKPTGDSGKNSGAEHGPTENIHA
ncbi:signal peptidase II [Streptomyces sp. S399]|uniref:signal peptidase II n=1 Tax=Streptomyces sp. S399 TaxID=3096009 RepID=UPI002A81B05D|nr:signal peptidase II [Streptomyces sp. S399]WPR52980.1 signal peptidase II [Streptomyces sp. S399]